MMSNYIKQSTLESESNIHIFNFKYHKSRSIQHSNFTCQIFDIKDLKELNVGLSLIFGIKHSKDLNVRY